MVPIPPAVGDRGVVVVAEGEQAEIRWYTKDDAMCWRLHVWPTHPDGLRRIEIGSACANLDGLFSKLQKLVEKQLAGLETCEQVGFWLEVTA